MTPDEPTLHHVLARLDATARYLAYLDKRFDDAVNRAAMTEHATVAAVEVATRHLDTTLARTTRYCVVAVVCAQLGQLVAVAALVLGTRGWA